jgi:hypothetical protein
VTCDSDLKGARRSSFLETSGWSSLLLRLHTVAPFLPVVVRIDRGLTIGGVSSPLQDRAFAAMPWAVKAAFCQSRA